MSVSITVAGSINLDIVAQGGRLPTAGETVMADTFILVPGGKGANQALAARRLGAGVTMVGAVGQDTHAEHALALLKKGGVNLDRIVVSETKPTGVALIAVSDQGENQITVVPGANGELSASHVSSLSGDGLICQLEIPVDTVQAAILGFEGLTVLNLAPVIGVPDNLLAAADVIVVNEHELAETGADRLKASGGLLAVTLGAEGAHLYRDGEWVCEAKPPSVEPVDTTGAGDTFTAALTLALLENQSHRDALDFACAAAAASTLMIGAQSSLPYRSRVEELLDPS